MNPHPFWQKFSRIIFFLILLVACEPLPGPLDQTITPPPILRIGISDGAGAMADLLTTYDRASIQFIHANEATLFTDLADGQLDAVLAYTVPADAWASAVAVDGLTIITHPESGIDGLSRAEVMGLFAGDGDVETMLFSRERGSGVRTLFEQGVMSERRISVHAIVQSSDEGMKTAVFETPAAIGYSMMSSLSPADKALPVDGIAPSPATVTAQTYPLTAPLYAIAPAEPTGTLRDFVAWLQSVDGQTAVNGVFGTVR